MGLHQTKKFLHSKGNQQKDNTEWENTLTNPSDKRLISKILKVLTKPKTQITQLKMDEEPE